MDFLMKAATMALAVIASVFSSVEAPKAQAKPSPVMSPASFTPTPQEFVFKCERPGSVVIVKVQQQPTQNDLFLEWIRGTQTGSKPVANVPWYTRTEEFTLPSLGETAGVLEALFAPKSDL